MSHKLRACPFCGRKDAWVARVNLQIRFAYTVQCACGAKVANYDTRKAAIDVWNGGMLRKAVKESK